MDYQKRWWAERKEALARLEFRPPARPPNCRGKEPLLGLIRPYRRRRSGVDSGPSTWPGSDQATASGQLRALLRREGLYSSHLAAWWKQRDAASLEALALKRRGHKAAPHSPLVEENKRITREGAHLHRKLRRTEAILDVQKKLSQGLKIILGTELPPNDYESEP